MQMHVGSIHENDDEQGVAHFVEHVTFLGSTKRESLLSLGVRSNAYTDFHHTVFHMSSELKNDLYNMEMLPHVIDALAEIAFRAEFLRTRIEKERKAVLAEAQMMNTIEYRMDCQLLGYLHEENELGNRFPIGLVDQVPPPTRISKTPTAPAGSIAGPPATRRPQRTQLLPVTDRVPMPSGAKLWRTQLCHQCAHYLPIGPADVCSHYITPQAAGMGACHAVPMLPSAACTSSTHVCTTLPGRPTATEAFGDRCRGRMPRRCSGCCSSHTCASFVPRGHHDHRFPWLRRSSTPGAR